MSTDRSFGDDRPIRTAIIGLGWAGRNIWLPRLVSHPAYEVVAAVEPDAAAVAAAAVAEHGVAVYRDIDELSPADVDLAIVAVPNHLHASVAGRALTLGLKNVFVEKPVCLTTVEARRLATAEAYGDAVLLAGSAARYRADVAALSEVVPTLGALRHIDVAWVRARGVPDTAWFTRRQLAGGGALVDLGWHLLDTVLPLIGPMNVHQVIGTVSDDFVQGVRYKASWRAKGNGAGSRRGITAKAGRSAVLEATPPREEGGRPNLRLAGDVEDTVRAFLTTTKGVSVSLHASWASHAPLDSTVISVEGSAGAASLACTFGFSPNRRPGSVLTCTRDGQATEVPIESEPVGAEYDRQLDELVGQVTDPMLQGAALAEATRTIGIIERIYQSAGRGMPAR